MSEKKYWEEELETLPRPKLEQLQLNRLQNHLSFAYQRSPYYRQAFDAAGVKPADLKCLEDLRLFPFTDKNLERDRQIAAPDFGDMVAVPEEENSRYAQGNRRALERRPLRLLRFVRHLRRLCGHVCAQRRPPFGGRQHAFGGSGPEDR